MTTRRKFLTILGGGTIAAAGGAATWAMTRDPAQARRPWTTASALDPAGTGDIRRYALAHAILAPNPHNRQPWIADLSTPGEVALYCQSDRRLPHTDPFDRQITIGLGCFSELLVMAAAEAGYRAEAEFFPEGEPHPRLDGRPVARFRFAQDGGATPDSLFAYVFERHTNREPFDTGRPVDPAVLAEIAAAARTSRGGFTAEPDRLGHLRELAWQAMETELRTYRTAKESIDLLRIGKAEIEANPDGISLAGPLMEGLDKLGLLARDDMLDTSSTVFRQQLAAMKPPFETAMAFMWLTTDGNSRASQIAAGRDHLRVHLAVTAKGLALQPFSQALQEFEEMEPHFATMRDSLGIASGDTLQMLVRLGYGPKTKPAPRWPLESRIRSA